MIYDKVIQNGLLVNPEARTELIGNLGILDGKIAAISTNELQAKEYFDAKGYIVSPGFIDIHGHVDGDEHASKLSLLQGITTTVGGNCGHSPINLKTFFQEQKNNPLAINQAELMGMTSSLRNELGGIEPQKSATKLLLKEMQYLVEKGFSDGACGLSIGLAYAPGTSDDEIYTLCKIAAKHNRIVTVDTRIATPCDLYSLVETIQIARKTGVRMQISHFVYQYGTGLVEEALSAINYARMQGIDIRLDSGMYTQWTSGIHAVLFDEESLNENKWQLDNILVITGEHKGQRLNKELYKKLRSKPRTDEMIAVVVLTGIEEEIYRTLNNPWCMPSTDIGRYKPGEGHPQIAGTFPRYFRKLVYERKQLTLLEAVRKATLLPAQTLNLKQKGRLDVGYDADLVVFDINNIKDNAWFLPKAEPDAPPDGIKYVFVNGKLALEENQFKNIHAGQPIVY